jgi:hypothetical protein
MSNRTASGRKLKTMDEQIFSKHILIWFMILFLGSTLFTACNPNKPRNSIHQARPIISPIDAASLTISAYSEIVANQRYHYQGDVSICLTSATPLDIKQEEFIREINPNTYFGTECKNIRTKFTDRITIFRPEFDDSGSSVTVKSYKWCGNTCSYYYTYKFRKLNSSWIMTEYIPGPIS